MQEPGGAEKVETCMRNKFNATFPMFEKVHVNGKDTHPVWRWLRLKGSEGAEAIPWNFNLFLVGRDGETVTRYSNQRTPSSLRDDIVSALEATPQTAARAKPPPEPVAPPETVSKAETVAGMATESPASVVAAM